MKLQYFGPLMQRTDSLEKTLMLGKTEGKSRRRWQRIRWLDGVTDSRDMNLSKLWEIVKDRGAWCTAVCGIAESDTTEQLNKKFIKKKNFSLAYLVKVCQEWFITHFSKCLHMKYCSILWNDFYLNREI